MAYIYIIKNDINDKVYIGKTNFSIQKRWKEHRADYQRRRNEKRPLYNAMLKYGIDHFFIEQLEECSIDVVSKREVYWINYYNSFENGYNATLGGDGKTYLDYKKILKLYDTTNLTCKEIANQCSCSTDSVVNICNQYRDNVNFIERANERKKKVDGKSVKCIELDLIFDSLADAVNYVKKIGKCKASTSHGPRQHIADVCKGRRKTAYSYHWIFV